MTLRKKDKNIVVATQTQSDLGKLDRVVPHVVDAKEIVASKMLSGQVGNNMENKNKDGIWVTQDQIESHVKSFGQPKENAPLPYDEGMEAYQNRLLPEANPYPETGWQHEEWWKGWSAGNDMDSEDSYDWASESFRK